MKRLSRSGATVVLGIWTHQQRHDRTLRADKERNQREWLDGKARIRSRHARAGAVGWGDHCPGRLVADRVHVRRGWPRDRLSERGVSSAAMGESADTWGTVAAGGAAILTFVVLRKLLRRSTSKTP